ncbi:hypothetical protein SDC9_113778 [bioreactor metagenome]|uniref:Uncharacterized protein n=1 Tax=bioreactor metagenome TaxID=1076179 RepID=A0A645BNC5_9ZZZZ
MTVRVVPLVVKSGVPAQVLRRDLHLLREHVPLLPQECHPSGGVVIAQPGGVLPPQGNDWCPDVAGMPGRFLRNLRQHQRRILI